MKDLIHNTKRETLKEITPLSEAYMKLEKCWARRTAADALAEDTDIAILAMSAAQAYICEYGRGGIDNDIIQNLQEAMDDLRNRLRQYREAGND